MLLAKMTENKEHLEKSISELNTTHLDVMSSRIEHCQHVLQDTRDHVSELQRNATSYHEAAVAKSDGYLNSLGDRLDRLQKEIRNLFLDIEANSERTHKAWQDESLELKEAVNMVERNKKSRINKCPTPFVLLQLKCGPPSLPSTMS